MTLKINLDAVLNRIYAESAWRAAHRNDVYTLTPDNERMLSIKVGQGLNELLARMAGYVTAWNYNPNLLQDNILLNLKLDGDGLDEDILQGDITEALAFYALLQFYGEQDTYYGTAWRKHRAHIMLLLCRPSVQ
ncbi:MAG: hypothetical protein J5980_05165 [Muribaculaceae bacterium]|nr:hypothetical protein [Muribaculaceae bacterium]